jgi:hypothetical protein
MKNQITLIGDCHGKLRRYHEIIREKNRHPYTLQIGDFTTDDPRDTLKNVDPNCHKILYGNHDRHSLANEVTHNLGEFGLASLNGVDFFFVKGAYSIDRMYRTIGVSWWPEEELTMSQWEECFTFYETIKPNIMITHSCPSFLVPNLIPKDAPLFHNRTDWGLERLFLIHKPKLWIFGHFHMSWEKQHGDTFFKCLNELETYILKADDWV